MSVARGRRLLWIGKTNGRSYQETAKLELSKKNLLVLSAKEAILKAEILQALHMVGKNHSFASPKGDFDSFRLMFLTVLLLRVTSIQIQKFNMKSSME